MLVNNLLAHIIIHAENNLKHQLYLETLNGYADIRDWRMVTSDKIFDACR